MTTTTPDNILVPINLLEELLMNLNLSNQTQPVIDAANTLHTHLEAVRLDRGNNSRP